MRSLHLAKFLGRISETTHLNQGAPFSYLLDLCLHHLCLRHLCLCHLCLSLLCLCHLCLCRLCLCPCFLFLILSPLLSWLPLPQRQLVPALLGSIYLGSCQSLILHRVARTRTPCLDLP